MFTSVVCSLRTFSISLRICTEKANSSSVFNFCFIPLIYFFYPETQNLTLEQIDKLFTGEKILLHWQGSMGEKGATTAGLDSHSDTKEGSAVEHQVEALGA